MASIQSRLSFLFVLSLFLSGCGLLEWKDKALSALVARIPIEMEVSLGGQILPTLLPAEALVRHPALQDNLEQLLRPLIERNNISSPPIRIFISKDPAINAFAIPGGKLIFNAGFLNAAESPEEVLGVAAHEIAHATQRHVVKSMVQSLSLAAIVSFFLGDISGIGAYILQQSQMLLQNGFSRVQEAEADELAFQYLVQARIDPRGMVQFFQRIQELESGQSQPQPKNLQKVNNFFSSHPLTQDRIRMIESKMQQLSAKERESLRAVRFNLVLLKKQLSEALR